MEGDSSDSVSSKSGGGSSISPRSSNRTTLFAHVAATGAAGSGRGRSLIETASSLDSPVGPTQPKTEIGEDLPYEPDKSAAQVAAFSAPSAPIGNRAASPLRRGPGRPRKDASGNLTARGKMPGGRVRGGGRGRVRSQFSNRQLSLSLSSTTTSPVDQPSSSPATSASAFYGVDIASSFDDETGQLLDVASAGSRDQRCAFCYLTQSSRLGQGELIRHSPTPGFSLTAFAKQSARRDSSPTASLETLSGNDPTPSQESPSSGASTEQLTLRINLKHSKVVRAKKKADVFKDESEPYDEIDKIGLPDDIELIDLFDGTGHCWAHHCCASWSDGVVQSDTFALLHVDSAAAAAVTQKCAGCGRMGASITCRANGCGRKFHYPCASAYGGFQDIKTLAFLCPEHLDEVATLPDACASCSKCETVGDIASQLFCTSCGDHYHADCLEPPVGTSVTVRAGWQCPECKMCQHCQRYGDDSRMLVCDSCDKGYHVYCMQPPMNTIPKSGWKCKNCRICTDCGSRTPGSGPSSRWHLNYSICDSCYQQRNKGLFCPLCERAYRHLKLKSMRQCSQCKKHVHVDCIRKSLTSSASEASLTALVSSNAADYVCPVCQGGDALGQQHRYGSATPSIQEPAMTPSSSVSLDENEEAETEMLAIFMKNEMAGGEDSLSGAESPFPELDALGDMDVDGVMQLLEPEETTEFSSDLSFSTASLEGKRSRGGGTAASLKKQAGLPRKRISMYSRTSSRAKTSSCSSSAAGSVRGAGGNVVDKRRTSKSGGSGGGRGGGGARGAFTALQATLQNIMSCHNNGGAMRKKDDDEYIHTVVVSSNDEFVFCQDMCVICGSFGQGPEGHFIACMQCGQCYHPYCANININTAILRRGWRCLDCTVCEGCGRGDDEQHLLLCDDCDVSFHTYCLDPPLDTIPAGPWVCKWCSSCHICGDSLSSSDMNSSPIKICSKCDSVVACHLCHQKYAEGDFVIQCESCDRWCHCRCNGLTNEEAIDKVADKGFRCWFCRPNVSASGTGHDATDGRNVSGFSKAVDSSFHVVMDGVSLTKTGLRTIQWRPRRRAAIPATTAASVVSMSALDDVIDSVHAYVTRGLDEHGTGGGEESHVEERLEPNDTERLNVDTSAENTAAVDPSLFSPMDKKKFARPKKYFKVGVGGFLVRQTRQRSTNEKSEDLQETQEIATEAALTEDGRESVAGDAATTVSATVKPKKRKRHFKKVSKLQLEDNYPSYIQEAFFGYASTDGRSNVDYVKPNGPLKLDDQESPLLQTRILADNELESVAPPPSVKTASDKHQTGTHRRGGSVQYEQQLLPPKSLRQPPGNATTQQEASGRRASTSTNQQQHQQQDPIGEGFEDLGEGDDIFPHQMDIHQHEFSNLIDMLMGDGDMDPVGHEDGEQRHSPNLENLIDSRDYVGIGEVDTAEMDRLMGNMLDDELRGACDGDSSVRNQVAPSHHHQQQPQQHAQHQQHLQEQHAPASHVAMVPNQPVIPPSVYHHQQQQASHQFSHDQAQQFVTQQLQAEHMPPHHPYGVSLGSMPPHHLQQHTDLDAGQDPARFLSTPQQQFPPQSCPPPATPLPQESHGPAGGPGAQPYHGSSLSPKGGESSSTADAKTYFERWEPDESLGDRATIAAVLYANMNYPDLRLKHPTWTERAKQIAKLWRLLAPEARQQYVQMARENRAACRQMIKAKKAETPRQSAQATSLSSSPDLHRGAGFAQSRPTNAPRQQDYRPPNQQGDGMADVPSHSFGTTAGGTYGGNAVLSQAYGAPATPTAIMHQSSRADEFKVPQTPSGSVMYRPETLKRSDSQPHPVKDSTDHVKTEPFGGVAQQHASLTADQSASCGGAGGNQQMYGSYVAPVGYAVPSGAYEQQYVHPSADWNRCQQQQPSLLEDFIEMERRDQRSRQPSVAPPQQLESATTLMDGSGNRQQSLAPVPPQWSTVPPQQQLPPQNSNATQNFPFCPTEVAVQRQRFPTGPPSTGTIEGTVRMVGSMQQTTSRDRQHEEWLSRTQHEFEVQMKAVETELNQLRRNKKNIAAKQRQLKKNGLELSTDDSNYLARLSQDISERQKQLELLRKQAKQHNNLVQDYNVKHGGLTALTPPSNSGGTAGGVHRPPHQNALMAPGTPMLSPVAGSHSTCGMDVFESSQQFGRPSSVVPATPTPYVGAMPVPAQRRFSQSESNQFSDVYGRVDPQGPPMVVPPPPHPFSQAGTYRPNVACIGQQPPAISPISMAFPNVTTTATMSFQATPQIPTTAPVEQKKKKKYYGKKKAETGGASKNPSDLQASGTASAGRGTTGCKGIQESDGLASPCPQSNLLAMASDYEVDVVITVSQLLDKAVAELDGPSSVAAAERENILLKRLLDASSPGVGEGDERKKAKQGQAGKRAASFAGSQGSPKKRQRKIGAGGAGTTPGSKGKSCLTGSQNAVDAHSVFIEQLALQLKTLPPLPIQEPSPKADPLLSNIVGVTQLIQKAEKPFITGAGPGNMQLTFMPDYYLDVFDKPVKQQHEQQTRQSNQQFLHQPSGVNDSYDVGNASAAKHNLAVLKHQQQIPQQQQQQQLQTLFLAKRNVVTDGSERQHLVPMDGTQMTLPRSLAESPLEVVYSGASDFEEDILPTYPALKPVMPAEGRLSPNFRLVAPVPMRAVPADPPTFYEQAIPSLPSGEKTGLLRDDDSDLVNVTLTLDVSAAQRVHDVLRGLAALLQIDVPQQFEVHIDTPPHTPEKGTYAFSKDAVEFIQQDSNLCRNCEAAVQQAAVRKKLAELGLTPKEDDADEVIFCSQRCYDQFTICLKAPSDALKTDSQNLITDAPEERLKGATTCAPNVTAATAQVVDAVLATPAATASATEQQETAPKNSSGFDANEESRLDEIIKSVLGDSQGSNLYGSKEEVVHVKDLPKYKDSSSSEDVSKLQAYEKRWKGTKWKPWSSSASDHVLTVVGRSVDAMYMEASKCLFRPAVLPSDLRVCDFCAVVGDGPMESSGRLLNLDAGRWVHVNCALWSAEVYERVEGALVNVEQAVRRALNHVCSRCQRYGASVPCYKLRCEKNYHFPCAVEAGCTFLKDKTMLCPNHASGAGSDVVLTSLAVIRRVYVERDENRIIAKLYQQGDSGELALRVGSLIFGHVGQLLPHQLRNFHDKDFIYPVGYAASRIYWSSKDVRKRNIYLCSISDNEGQPEFVVTYNEENFSDVTYASPAASGAWNGILNPLEQLRTEAGMLKLFSNFLSGESLFGLTESAIVKMIESLPGVDMMLRYECKYGRSPLIDLPLAVNPSGCARCEPRFRTYIKRSHTHTASTSGSFQSLLALSGLSNELAFYQYSGNRQTLVSKWSQYRKMKQEWQNNVYLARSTIQGLGLYAKRDIEMNAMVIEYIGECIRNEVAERREKLYQTHNRGIYMFRIDEERVLDATVSGGLARYINHSCDPNCVAELFEFDREPKIIIMSCRPITKGEELTYDYQFDVEDDSNKIPCLCGAPNCQKWMN